VIERIREELSTHQFNLIETLGEFIVKLLFDEFGAPWVKLAIAKIGVMKDVRRVGVFIERGRDGSPPPEHAPTAGLPR
jgi:dihydroneopterin aldolase